MIFEYQLMNLFSYFCFYLGGFLIWPSRKNIPALIQIPFFISAIFIPIFVVNYNERFTDIEITKLTLINFFGACFLIFGIITGKLIKVHNYIFLTKFYNTAISFFASKKNVILRLIIFLFFSCFGLTICFFYMGFIPILEGDPMMAKYFKGDYKVIYDDVSFFFRLFQTFLFLAIPVSLFMIFQKINKTNKFILIFLTLWSILLFAVNLYRGPVFSGIMMVLALFAAKSSYRALLFVLLLTLIYCFGSVIYYFLGLYNFPDNFNWLNEISKGQPDIQDHLIFISKFSDFPIYSGGITFIGALVPGNFEYNPAVYSLNIINPNNNITDIPSGGLRMTVYLHAFMAFSWVGTLIFSFIYGLLLTRYTLILKGLNNDTLYNIGINTLWFLFVASFFLQFYHLKYQGLIMLFFIIVLLGQEMRLNVRKK